jgi:phage-related baseplate assembly protein
MVTIRSVNEIIASLIDFYRLAQPDLDTKPGTVGRDLFIEGPSAQLSLLYDQLQGVSNKQSLRLSIGTDLDKLGKNFGLIRKQSTPSSGVALLTFSSLNAVININKGTPVYTAGGLGFTVTNGTSLVPSNINFYRSVATKFSAQLQFVGITDQFAVQVTVTASAPGSASNIGQYTLSKVSIPGISNVTNTVAFSGGTDQETDAAFRNRVLSTFNGSSVGTSLGYLNAALSVTGVQDAVVIGPGDPLMTRDGTISKKINGVLTIVSEGSGGKVDIAVLGTNDISNTDTFIYQDKSNNNDPTSSKNNFVLGQIASDANLSIAQRRITDIKNGQLPAQPVDSIIQVTGSVSGTNFTPFTIDQFGRGSGNYDLVKDTGVYGGSPFGFDTFVWKSNQIAFQEDLIKGQTNGQDPTTFTGVLQITDAQQQLGVTNENSTVTSDRSIIQLLHTPATNVTRVFNTNTGERYLITNQNLDVTTPFNNTGRIQISGNTLPSPSDILQVDYTWIVDYDRFSDFDGLLDTQNPRTVTDSIDWGYPSAIKSELVDFALSSGNNFYIGTTTHPVDTIVSADQFLQVDGYVQLVTSGTFVNRLSVVVHNLSVITSTVDSITWKNSNSELFKTAQGDGTFTSAIGVVGIQVIYTTTIILPSDTVAQVGDRVTTYLNSTDVFHSSSAQGSSNGTQVTIPSSLISTTADRINLRVTYIANVNDLFSSITTTLPASRAGNGYVLSSNNGFNNFSIINVSKREHQVVGLNLSNQFFVELSISSSDYSLFPDNVLSVVRLSDGKELWNPDHEGQVTVGLDGNYQLIFSGYNVPVVNDRVLVIYYAADIRRFQPFSFNNTVIKTRIDHLGFDQITAKFTVPLISLVNQASGLNFEVVEQNSDTVLFSVTDGYLTTISPTEATLNSLTVNFSTLSDLTNKRVKITNAVSPNNDGYFDILGYDLNTNNITITTSLDHITADQISVIRIADGKELWNYSGTIDQTHNRLLIPAANQAVQGDLVYVMFFNFSGLRKAPTRVIGVTLDQIVNTGVITVGGTTMALASDVLFTVTSAGLKQNLQEALRTALGLASTASIPPGIKIAKIVKASKVTTFSPGSSVVTSTLATYDVLGSTISNNLYFSDTMLADPTLSGVEFVLPATINNTSTGAVNNLPAVGDEILITFYYTTDNDSENLSYTRIGTLYTNKKFALINKLYVNSGFQASQNTKFTATSFTKPSVGARYTIFYDYLAPKQNERILIQYNYNKLMSDTTFTVENNRPINADVLVRAAKLVLLDLTMNVVINANFVSTQTTVLQNLRNQLVAALTTNKLGQTIDQITLINIAQGVQGVDRARILYFNVHGKTGQVLSITANEDQYFQSNTITINTETR